MNYKKFGKTDLIVSEIGFGAWAIGGPAMVGNIPIGWGNSDDNLSKNALVKAFDKGINFFDTADFYGLGHSENLIGEILGKNKEVIIATKVGHRIEEDKIILDYSKNHILKSCEESLKRLKRDCIDYYQLHSAKVEHLKNGECIDAMNVLTEQGKIRYWGISLSTFSPYPEAEYFFQNKIGFGFQVAFNLINQRAKNIIEKSAELGYGIIARMPLQFGLLTGKFNENSVFEYNDHRSFRLTSDLISKIFISLKSLEPIIEKYGVTKTTFALSFVNSFAGVSTIIPGMRNPDQVEMNSIPLIKIEQEDLDYLYQYFKENFDSIVENMN